MTTTAIRRQLHNYVEVAEDKKIKAIYTMMEEEIKGKAVEYTDEFKAELDSRYGEYKKNNVKTISASESKKRIQKILKANLEK